MFLKSLTLRGFKSFADKSLLEFEPGITVIVGPNGSGKSNIVDALSWALGSASPKSLRGGAMSDVIFAGAAGRPGLGRAAVDLVIDNSAGTLPVEFSEVTVSRATFATGEGSYAINGVECRALDVAELLSDTGLGREQHTIVGQGQLDAVLTARPEDRRAFVEEAAGILKHRKRKERALRKLAQMEGHLERLGDVLRELRRALRPLERQAETAAKHAELVERLRQVRLVRALRELAALTDRRAADEETSAAGGARLAELRAAVARVRDDEAAIERQLAETAPHARAATETHLALAGLVERSRGLTERLVERRRGLVEAVEEPVAGRDPAALRDEAAEMRDLLTTCDADLAAARRALGGAESERVAAEEARRAHDRAAAAEARRRAEARERVLRWEGELAALRSGLAQASAEEGRLSSRVQGLAERGRGLDAEVAEADAEHERLALGIEAHRERLAAARSALAVARAAADRDTREERELDRRRASLEARADALRAASRETTGGAAALRMAADEGAVVGLAGPLAEHVRVADGMAQAVAAALGPLGDALVAEDRTAAQHAVGFARGRGAGRVLLLPGDGLDGGNGDGAGHGALRDGHGHGPDRDGNGNGTPPGARPLVAALSAEPRVLAALRRALDGVWVVDDFAAACVLAAAHPDQVFITAEGDVAGPRGYAGGDAAAGPVLSHAAADEAERWAADVAADLVGCRRRVAAAERAVEAARVTLDDAATAARHGEAAAAGAADRLARLSGEAERCRRELVSARRQAEELARDVETRSTRLAEVEARDPHPLPPHPEPEGPDLAAERLETALAQAREREVEARLAVGAVHQRGVELAGRAEALEREAADMERQLAEREARRRRRRTAIARCGQLEDVAAVALRRAESSLARAAAERERLDDERGRCQRELGALRARGRDLEAELARLLQERHAEELARSELQHAIDAVAGLMRDELGVDPDTTLADARATGDSLAGGQERDERLAREEERLVRKVGLLGRVNPLAMQEYEELQARHRFLVEQIEDVRASRRDLIGVVDAVDERIREVFGAAFADIAVQFERIVPLLFPGGEGRLVLTAPTDLLATGVEVEVRPAGKRVKRLSLLSGGERSLAALAVLFAIFAARPSPFYVLDEVEAALDDVNLQRFLSILEEFRGSSQLLVVTHQRRTMEIADCLYGVSMQWGGVSKVVSQRLRHVAAS